MNKFNPVILIGLGKYGAEIAAYIYSILNKKEPILSGVISCLLLHEDGRLVDGEGTECFKLDGLHAKISDLKFSHNFSVITGQEKKFENILDKIIESVQQRDKHMEIQEHGIEIKDKVEIYLISSLCDTIGSVALTPFLGFINYLLTGRLRGTVISTNIIGFFPDLFDDYKKIDFCYARSYTCLQELDNIADTPTLISSEDLPPYNLVHLFTSRNEDGQDIGNYKDLVPLIGEFLFSFLSDEIASDISFSSKLLNKVDGKTARFSSIGIAKLVFPKKEVTDGFFSYLSSNIMKTVGLDSPKPIKKDQICADVKTYIISNKLDKLRKEFEVDVEGRTIWNEFLYKGQINERIPTGKYISNIDEQGKEFDKTNLTEMNRKLSLRRQQLMDNKMGEVASHINESMDFGEKGIFYAKSFLDVFQNQECEYAEGDADWALLTIDNIENDAKSYFDNLLGIDRNRMLKLKREVKEKKETLENLKKAREEEESQDTQNDKTEELKGEEKKEEKEEVLSDKSKNNAFKNQIDSLNKEFANLSKQYKKAAKEISLFDQKISSAPSRKILLDDILSKQTDQKLKMDKELIENENKYIEKRRELEALYGRRKREFFKWFMAIPFVATLILFILGRIATDLLEIPIVTNFLKSNFIKIYPFLFLLYLIYAMYKFWKVIGKKIKELKIELGKCIADKVNSMVRIRQFYNLKFHTIFEFVQSSGLLYWVKEFKKKIKALDDQLKLFISSLKSFQFEREKAWEDLTFPNNLFVRSIVAKEDLSSFIDNHQTINLEINRYFDEKSLSFFFENYIKCETIENLESSIQGYTTEIFKPFLEKPIDNFLAERDMNDEHHTAEKLDYLHKLANAFILLDVEKGMDKSSSIDYLGIWNPEQSYINEVLHEQRCFTCQVYSQSNIYEVNLYRLKFGFPAFHIALSKHGRRLLFSRGNKKDNYYINPEWQLQDLFPSIYTMGDEEDLARRNACLGLAFNLIRKEKNKFYFNDQVLGNSYNGLIDYLRSFSGSDVRNKLSALIENEKKNANAIDTLLNYKKRKRLDSIDKNVIDSVINEISPLT